MSRLKDLSGMTFAHLTVLHRHSCERDNKTRWICRCVCGRELSVLSSHLIQGNSRSCGCMRPRAKDRKQWTGHELISGQFWHSIKRNAIGIKRRVLDFEITIEDAWDLYENQDRRCALSGLPIHFARKWGEHSTASLDRIDNSKGYIKDNIQWVHKDINMMKRNLDQDYFLSLCQSIANNQG